MQLQTKAFGKIDIQSDQIISFPDGLLGFPDNNQFALIEDQEESFFKWLQSIDDRELAFIVMQPELFMGNNYNPRISQQDLELLDITDPSDTLILVIVTLPPDHPEKMTANLQGPVLINHKKKIGRQVISLDDNPVRISILEQMEG